MNQSTKRSPYIWGIFARPRRLKWLLAALPFLASIIAYTTISSRRHEANPAEKLMPEWGQMAKRTKELATEPNKRTGKLVFWDDTRSSIVRIGKGIGLATVISVVLAIVIGVFPAGRAFGQNFVNTISFIPPVAILPILLVAIGVGEASKVGLIFLGTFPLMTRDLSLYVRGIPREQIIKTMTLGASQWQLIWKVIFPQMVPRIIETVRLSIGAGWIFLIVAEGISSSEGLGYRIFQARRYMAMDTIIPYVIWITFLAFIADMVLRLILHFRYPWYRAQKS